MREKVGTVCVNFVRGAGRRLVVAIRVATDFLLLGTKVKVSDAFLPKQRKFLRTGLATKARNVKVSR